MVVNFVRNMLNLKGDKTYELTNDFIVKVYSGSLLDEKLKADAITNSLEQNLKFDSKFFVFRSINIEYFLFKTMKIRSSWLS